MLDDSAEAYTPFNLLAAELPVVGFGDYCRLSIQVTSTAPLAVGQTFIFNPCFFAPTVGAANFPLGIGWVIEILDLAGGGTLNAYMRTTTAQGDITQQNVKIDNLGIPLSNILIFDLAFYATQDIADYIRAAVRNNVLTMQSTGAVAQILDDTPNNIWRRGTGFLEFVIYECDAAFLPIITGGLDPYVRNPATLFVKYNSYPITAKFCDNSIGATQAWVGGALTQNNLDEVASFVNAYKFASFTRRPAPFYANALDSNFLLNPNENQLILNTQNDVTIKLKCPSFVPNYVVLRLWRVDAAAIQSAQPFVIEYDIKQAKATTDATAYPNPITIDPVFSTPAVISLAATTNLAFKINGNYLAANAEYRLWIGLYNDVTREVSTHLSRTLVTGSSYVPLLTITGNTKLYDYEYPNANDVTVSEYERFKAEVTLQGNTYTGGTGGFVPFLAQLDSVFVEVNDGVNILSQSRYDMPSNISDAPPITLDIAGFNYTFGYEYRAPVGTLIPLARIITVVFTALFKVPQQNGGFDIVRINFAQLIRRRPQNLVRLPVTRFLDYSEFVLGNIVPIDTFCSDTTKYIVEAELDAVPLDATLQAYAIFGAPTTQQNISEEQDYSSLYLTQLFSPQLSDLDSTFGIDKKAYFVLDISRFPANATYKAVGVNAVSF
jgi:hypothetical protein